MSPLIRNNLDPSNPLYYAPPRLRQNSLETPIERPADESQGSLVPSGTGQTPARLQEGQDEQPRRQSRIFEEAVSRALQESLEPEAVHSPSLLNRRAGRYALWGLIVRFALAAVAAAVIALFFVTVVPFSRSPVKPGEDGTSMASIWQSLKTSLFPAPQRKQASTLVVNDSSGTVNEPLQLGISVTAPSPGASVTLKGLPSGARLTAGKRIGANDWRVPAQEISAAAVIPPDDFTGQITVTAELRGDDGDALVGGSVHLAWAPASPGTPATLQQPQALPTPPPPAVRPQQALSPAAPSSTAPSSSTAAAPPMPIVRTLDPREIASFLNRAQDLIAAGDLPSARLLLRRAAEAQNARAALALAQTYDPLVLKQYGSSAPAADVATARNWYERAREWGAPDVQRQLDALEAFAR
jgi:hypothetical protein